MCNTGVLHSLYLYYSLHKSRLYCTYIILTNLWFILALDSLSWFNNFNNWGLSPILRKQNSTHNQQFTPTVLGLESLHLPYWYIGKICFSNIEASDRLRNFNYSLKEAQGTVCTALQSCKELHHIIKNGTNCTENCTVTVSLYTYPFNFITIYI
jgi:hypothetical protein